ncbi:acid-sensing ion channel 5-like [Branchiostoma floridae]|uniref:Acid-sensing ion channel 5-like n=1 Tax=Branchiostoma floridae TaxID=7739 RepID=A0A9J7LH77_BRAFL|nr:acid-sensing ion channel 5-like [Branchiostoma floridae]
MASCCGADSAEREYAEGTSLHGLGKIVGARHGGARLAWSLLFLTMFGVAAWQITERFVAYFQFDTVTNMKVEFRDVLDFPTVTICNFNKYRFSKITAQELQYVSTLLEGSTGFNDYDYDSDYEDSDQYNFDWNSTGIPDGFNLAEFTLRAGFDMDVSLIGCTWRGQACSKDNFTLVFTSFGICWVFNEGGTLNQTIAGVGNGLRVAINIQQDEYTENALTGNLDAGIRFVVHSPNEPPTVDTQGISVGPGTHAYASISKIQYTNEVPPWGKCEPGRTLRYYSGYTKTGCLLECRAGHVADACGCRTVSMPGTLDYCQPSVVTGCVKTTMAELKSGKQTCDCPTPCSATAYPATVSYGGWPSSSTKEFYTEYFNMTEEQLKDNIVLLDIYYQQLNLQTVQQRRAISTNALLGDLGGQLGLFLGASVITIIEFLEFLLKKGTSCCCKNRVKTLNPNTEEF